MATAELSADTFLCELATPERLEISTPAQMVVVPGAEGDFGVLPGHAPFVSSLRPGVISIQSAAGERRIAVTSGLAEVTPSQCIILAEQAVDLAQVTPDSARLRLEAARQKMDDADTDDQRALLQPALTLAEIVAESVA